MYVTEYYLFYWAVVYKQCHTHSCVLLFWTWASAMITYRITSTQNNFLLNTETKILFPVVAHPCSVNEWKCVTEEALIKHHCTCQWFWPSKTQFCGFDRLIQFCNNSTFACIKMLPFFKPSVLHIHTLHVSYMFVLRGVRLILWSRLRGHTVWSAVWTEAPHATAPAVQHKQTQIVKVIWPLSHLPLGVVGFQEWGVHVALRT